ncbi:MAG: response regulator [Syntrophobacteraceae bacterium]
METEIVSEKILVVDDDVHICTVVKSFLELKGYDPIVCTNPMQALELSDNHWFGLAFVDINLPNMSGLDLVVKLREKRSAAEVVFITGSDVLEHAVQAIKLGASDFLPKPFHLSELEICLSRYEERKSLRKQIQLAEKRYYDLVQGLPLLVFVLRKDLRFDFVNYTCLSILGYTPEEIINIPGLFPELIHNDDRKRVLQLFQAMFQDGGPGFSTNCRMIHKKGRVIHTIVKSISTCWCTDGSDVVCVEGAIVDITDRISMEKALVQREKLRTLGAISAEVAHEVRNPLVAIGGFARRLQKKGMDQPELQIILNEAGRLERMLERIRDYLKPLDVHFEDCSINAIVENSLDLLSPEIERRQIDCLLDLSRDMPAACVDRDILGQVCINLIRNAAEAIVERGTLKVRTLEGDHNFHIEFRNRSTRPLVKDPESLFLPFDEGGQSIGLPLCNRLLKAMEGTISYSEEQGEIVFTVSLPKTARPCRPHGRIFEEQCA